MPDRIIRDRCRRSPTLKLISDAAERAWWRLTVTADDYGRFDADPEVCLASLFQRRPQGWTEAKMRNVLAEWGNAALVVYYEIGPRRYGQISHWSVYQRPPRLASKFPDPPGELTIPKERTIHSALMETIHQNGEFCGHPVLLIERNVRLGNGFADFVLTVPTGRILVEVKRTRADRGAIRQVVGYGNHLKDCVGKVIIASGLGPTVAPNDFENAGIALIAYKADGSTKLIVKSETIDTCSLVISQHITNVRGSRDERRETRDERREEDGATLNGVQSAPAPLDPHLSQCLMQTMHLKTLANGKHTALWVTLEAAYDQYEWLYFEDEIRKADAWMEANPAKRPTPQGLRRFMRNWFERAVEMGRKRHAQTKA